MASIKAHDRWAALPGYFTASLGLLFAKACSRKFYLREGPGATPRLRSHERLDGQKHGFCAARSNLWDYGRRSFWSLASTATPYTLKPLRLGSFQKAASRPKKPALRWNSECSSWHGSQEASRQNESAACHRAVLFEALRKRSCSLLRKLLSGSNAVIWDLSVFLQDKAGLSGAAGPSDGFPFKKPRAMEAMRPSIEVN